MASPKAIYVPNHLATQVMKRKGTAILAIAVLGVALFAFLVPVIYPDCFPVTCRVDGRVCLGGCMPNTGSITYWYSGYGGALVPDPNGNSIRPTVYQVFFP